MKTKEQVIEKIISIQDCYEVSAMTVQLLKLTYSSWVEVAIDKFEIYDKKYCYYDLIINFEIESEEDILTSEDELVKFISNMAEKYIVLLLEKYLIAIKGAGKMKSGDTYHIQQLNNTIELVAQEFYTYLNSLCDDMPIKSRELDSFVKYFSQNEIEMNKKEKKNLIKLQTQQQEWENNRERKLK